MLLRRPILIGFNSNVGPAAELICLYVQSNRNEQSAGDQGGKGMTYVDVQFETFALRWREECMDRKSAVKEGTVITWEAGLLSIRAFWVDGEGPFLPNHITRR